MKMPELNDYGITAGGVERLRSRRKRRGKACAPRRGMACRCVVKVCRSLASHMPLDIRRDVALTYMLYLAFCLMLRGLLRYDINWAWKKGGAVLDLNDMTIAGLAVGEA